MVDTTVNSMKSHTSTQIARFMWPARGQPGSSRPQLGPVLAPWTYQGTFVGLYMYDDGRDNWYKDPSCNNMFSSSHYSDVIMGTMASQITSLTIVYSSVYSGADQGKQHSSAPLAFVRGNHWWPVNSLHKWPVIRKMFPFEDVIMLLNIQEESYELLLKCRLICLLCRSFWFSM